MKAVNSSRAPVERSSGLPRAVDLYYKFWLGAHLVGAALGLVVALYVLSGEEAAATGVGSVGDSKYRIALASDTSSAPTADYDYTAPPEPPVLMYYPPKPAVIPEDISHVMRTLKFSHLWQDDKYEKYVFGDPVILNQMMLFISGTILTYLVIVNILSCFILPFIAPQFRELDTFGQMAVTTNSLYTILLLAQLVPYTVIIIGILFGDCRSKQFPGFYYTVFVFLTTHAIMYAYEGIVRSVIKVNYLLLIHHAMFFVFMILEFSNQSNFVVKCCLILDYFVVWEAGLYFTNVAYRLKINYTALKWVMIVGTTVHGVTHLVQAMLLTAFFIGMGKRMDTYHINRGMFATMVILCTALVFYQYYLEKIFYEMWMKVARAHREQAVNKADIEQAELANEEREQQSLLKDHVASAGVRSSDTGAPRDVLHRPSVELVRIEQEEKHMLGELPTFPHRMNSLRRPLEVNVDTSYQIPAVGGLTSPQGSAARPAPAGAGAGAAPQAAADSTKPAAAPKAKKKDDVLTDAMWEQTED